MSGHEAKSWSVRCQREDIEKAKKDQGRTKIETLLHQVTIGVIALAYQERRLKEIYA